MEKNYTINGICLHVYETDEKGFVCSHCGHRLSLVLLPEESCPENGQSRNK